MNNRRSSVAWTYVVGVLCMGGVALSLAYTLTADVRLQHSGAGASVHAKNAPTPAWILELQTRNAGQLPVTVQNDEPSFWI